MSKVQYRSIWISDAHLCSRDCRADYLLSFLRCNKSRYLYIIGDFIDAWQMKRRWYWPQIMNNVIQKVFSKAKKGTQVIYIPGNHDEGLREFAGVHFGNIQVVRDTIHETADGKRMLVLHGDEFDAIVQHRKWLAVLGDAAYGHLIWLNRIVNAVRKLFGMPYWSLSGYIKVRVKNAVSYVGSFEAAAVRRAREAAADGVICGHIHQPALKQVDGLCYANAGDWIENCTALVEHLDGRLAIVNWVKDWPDIALQMVGDEDTPEVEPATQPVAG